MSFSFGAPSSAPATTGLTGGFSFGTNKPATPGFGLTATSQPSTGLFATPATGTPSFGNTSFGATTTPGFGSIGTSSAAPAFGSTPGFGATSTAPSFGSTTPGFGTAAATGFASAGASTAPAFGALGTTAPAFGALGTTAPPFGALGTTAPAFGALGTTAPAFGANPTPAPGFGAGGLNFGAGSNTSAPSTGLSFGQPAASTGATGLGGLGGFNFGGTTAQSTGLSFGLGLGNTTTTSSLFGKLGTTTVTGSLPLTTATPSLGLGGALPTSGIGSANAAADAKNEPAKQQKLPNEISITVDSFKEFVKKQKALSSEVMRVSVKPLHTVSREAEATLRATLSLRGAVVRGRAASRRQRAAAAAALAAAEAAARDHAYPGSELEGSAPPIYVKELISELEQQLITFRTQMDIADKQMQSSPKLLTEQELNLGFRRMHESLVALAGRLQAVHTQVEEQKEQYINLRKYILKDPTNVFDTPTQNSMLDQILKDVDSSRKKIKPGGLADIQGAVLNDPRTALGGNVSQLAGPTPFNYMGNGTSAFALQDTTGPSWQPQATPTSTQLVTSLSVSVSAPTTDSSFQLQKPPGKRGKQ